MNDVAKDRPMANESKAEGLIVRWLAATIIPLQQVKQGALVLPPSLPPHSICLLILFLVQNLADL
jgi:hypothetical protein